MTPAPKSFDSPSLAAGGVLNTVSLGIDGHPTMPQAKDELRLFHEFLVASRLPALPATVESRLPPEPDIACRLADGSELRFELVEIVDEHFARMDLNTSPFRRVWVCDANTKSVLFESALRST